MFNKNGERYSPSLEKVYDKCGDADVKSGWSKKVDSVLKFYSGAPLVITNKNSTKEGRCNGKKRIGLKMKMKQDCIVDCKYWDIKLEHLGIFLNVIYMIYKTIPENNNEIPKTCKLKTGTDAVIIVTFVGNMIHKNNVKMIKFVVNSNKAITDDKLQGVSLNIMVVISWNYCTKMGYMLYCLK